MHVYDICIFIWLQLFLHASGLPIAYRHVRAGRTLAADAGSDVLRKLRDVRLLSSKESGAAADEQLGGWLP